MNRSLLTAALLAIAAAAWIASGQFGANGGEAELRSPPAEIDTAVAVTSVRVRTQQAQPYVTELAVNGHTEAERSVAVKAEIRGPVAALPLDKGTAVAAGAVVARIAEQERPAALAEARALLEQRRIEYEAARKLEERGFRAATQLAASKAAYEAAAAAVRRAEIDVARLTLAAPFEGVLDERYVEIGDYLDVGDPVARIVDLDPLLVVAYANEREVQDLVVGQAGTARLLTGATVQGRLRYVAPVANEATRSYRVELEVANPDYRLPAGMSAELRVPLREVPAHRISPALLVLDAEGALGVRTVGEDGRVHTLPVRLLQQDAEGLWVAGLPETVTLITVGQQFVTDGQPVRAVDEAAVAESLSETAR